MSAATAIGDHARGARRQGGGLRFYDLSHPWGHDAPLWPYFPDVKIERFHYHAKSGVLSQQITTFMHCTTHTDAPAHVIEGTRVHRRGAAVLVLRHRASSSRSRRRSGR